MQNAGDVGQQGLQMKGLAYTLGRTKTQGFIQLLGRSKARYDHYGRSAAVATQQLQHVEPGVDGHADVEQNQIEGSRTQFTHAFISVGRGFDNITGLAQGFGENVEGLILPEIYPY